jgi:hypothetical protein
VHPSRHTAPAGIAPATIAPIDPSPEAAAVLSHGSHRLDAKRATV